MFLTDLLFMSLAGSVVLLLQVALQLATTRYFSAKWHYRMISLSMIFFLVPVCEIRSWFPKEGAAVSMAAQEIKNINYYTLYYTPTGSILTTKNILFFLIALVWLAGMIWAVYSYVTRYIIFRSMLRFESVVNDNPSIDAIMEECKQKLGMKQHIELRVGSFIVTPVTTGMIHPMIILSEDEFTREELTYIFTHELIHIKHKDIWKKSFGNIIACIHWFNPLSRLLKRQIDRWAEMYCDEELVMDYDIEERRAYGSFILDMQERVILSMEFGAAFGSGKKSVKERLEYVMHNRKRRKVTVGVSIIVAMVMSLASTLAVFAMEKPIEIQMSADSVMEETDSKTLDESVFFTDKAEVETDIKELVPTIVSEEVEFVADNGELFEVNGVISEDGVTPYCNHTFTTGGYTQHLTYSDGSCKTNYYNAQICTKCNYVIVGGLYDYVIHGRCPH